MFHLSNRRFVGAKTKLLSNIAKVCEPCLKGLKKGVFLDIFAGTGVVSEYFVKRAEIQKVLINDFLHSNFAIYQGFFAKNYDEKKLIDLKNEFINLNPLNLKQNYYSQNFGDKFFSQNDSKIIGYIREKLNEYIKQNLINNDEFYILLASLIYSSDKIANTVGHYDAYRKNVSLNDKFKFELINPIKTDKKIEIFRQDANELARNLASKIGQKFIDIAFLDPPYNSRQYSRFYHLLENLVKDEKDELFGVALKPKPENLSEYCKTNALNAFADLIQNLAKISKNIVVTYNNTYTSKSNSSQNKIQLEQIKEILNTYAKTKIYEFDFKAFSSGKTDFKEHKEFIFVGQIL